MLRLCGGYPYENEAPFLPTVKALIALKEWGTFPVVVFMFISSIRRTKVVPWPPGSGSIRFLVADISQANAANGASTNLRGRYPGKQSPPRPSQVSIKFTLYLNDLDLTTMPPSLSSTALPWYRRLRRSLPEECAALECIDAAFARQAGRTPDRAILVDENGYLTYGELRGAVEVRAAALLRRSPGRPAQSGVGVLLENDAEKVVTSSPV